MAPKKPIEPKIKKKEININPEPDFIPIPPTIRRVVVGRKRPNDVDITVEADFRNISPEEKF